MAIDSSSLAAASAGPSSVDELSILLRQQCSRIRECVAEWSVLHKRLTAPVEELVSMMQRFQPMQLPLIDIHLRHLSDGLEQMSRVIDRIHTHRYTATAAVAAFTTQQQRSAPSVDAYAHILQSLAPTPIHTQPTTAVCTVGDYELLLCAYADMYDSVHQTSRLLLCALLAECGHVLAAASSVSAAVAGVLWKYVLVWRSECGRDSEREQQLDWRWKKDREWRKAESDRTATQRKSVGATEEQKSEKKKKKK